MEALFSLRALLATLLAPPFVVICLLTAALVQWRKSDKRALLLVVASALHLFLAATPALVNPLYRQYIDYQVLSSGKLRSLMQSHAQRSAIIVIGRGRLSRAPEYDALDQVDGDTLLLLAYAKQISGRTDAPLIVASIDRDDAATPASVLMNQSLSTRFGVSPRWMLSAPDPEQIRQQLASLLQSNQIEHLIVVSHSAYSLYWRQQFKSLPTPFTMAPAVFNAPINEDFSWHNLIPNVATLQLSQRLIHWWLGDRLY